jgi:hypothetical protein
MDSPPGKLMRRVLPAMLMFSLCAGHAVVTAQSLTPSASSLREWFSGSKEPPAPSIAPPAPKPDAPVHHLRQTTCSIPFTVDTQNSAPLELQLFVSTDQGSSWKFSNRASPSAGSFTFRASADGEYWFALRTIEKGRSPIEPSRLQPGLRVVFDTRQPALDFDAAAKPDGELFVKWEARDPWLDPDSLRIEYQTERNGPWQTISTPRVGVANSRELSSQQLVRLDPQATFVLVRAEVRDKAGNHTVVSRPIAPRDVASMRSASAAVTRSGVAAAPDTAGNGAVVWPHDNVLPSPARAKPAGSRAELPPPRPSLDHPPQASASDVLRNPYHATASQTNGNETLGNPRSGTAGDSEPVTAGPMVPLRPRPAAGSPADEPLVPNQVPREDDSPDRSSMWTDPPSPTASPAAGDAAHGATGAQLPAGDQPRFTNSREFSLDYEVESLGPAAIERVDLWGTSDGGRTWTRWFEDADRHSPADVTVQHDGIYGFRIVITSTNRLSTPQPQPGEPADIWVGVDTTPPTAQITAAPYGEGEHAGQLEIRWQAFDTGFGQRPISLLFSESPSGPWSAIAAGLPNTGSYFWAVEPRIPRRIYLRLVATDDAGNIGEHQLTEPINTAGLIPHARIRGIRVPTANDRSAARPR